MDLPDNEAAEAVLQHQEMQETTDDVQTAPVVPDPEPTNATQLQIDVETATVANDREAPQDVDDSESDTASDTAKEIDVDALRTEFQEFLAEAGRVNVQDLHSTVVNQVAEIRKQQQRQGLEVLSVTDEMVHDAKEILRLFGIPFIDALAEAEAQCAELELIGLVDGVVTDDSDIWLFGGQKVFKHLFDQKKYVEHFSAEHIKTEKNLSRETMICLALLLGSDYTEGVSGVGPVTAKQIVEVLPQPLNDIVLLRNICGAELTDLIPSLRSCKARSRKNRVGAAWSVKRKKT
eukprot:TRINITY_DN1950_c0_g1_i15.p1 TRINITY_DN1950_c0_g1~~TRINITY_DN1950_c0_g1_i15.p1  ORF type:complete len:291 (+),score=74.55 TRINITY_DN1950_c0_g1_i15:1597-2469(+)